VAGAPAALRYRLAIEALVPHYQSIERRGHTGRPEAEDTKMTKTKTATKTTPVAKFVAKKRAAVKPVCSQCGRDNGRAIHPDCRNLQACVSRLMNAA
jgi:hypothetical protein